MTETYRAGADGRDKLEKLLRTLYSLLQDLTFLNSSTPELVRNTDIQADLKKLSEAADFGWIAFAADRLNDVERGMRRNLLRSLSLDAFATALERSVARAALACRLWVCSLISLGCGDSHTGCGWYLDCPRDADSKAAGEGCPCPTCCLNLLSAFSPSY